MSFLNSNLKLRSSKVENSEKSNNFLGDVQSVGGDTSVELQYKGTEANRLYNVDLYDTGYFFRPSITSPIYGSSDKELFDLEKAGTIDLTLSLGKRIHGPKPINYLKPTLKRRMRLSNIKGKLIKLLPQVTRDKLKKKIKTIESNQLIIKSKRLAMKLRTNKSKKLNKGAISTKQGKPIRSKKIHLSTNRLSVKLQNNLPSTLDKGTASSKLKVSFTKRQLVTKYLGDTRLRKAELRATRRLKTSLSYSNYILMTKFMFRRSLGKKQRLVKSKIISANASIMGLRASLRRSLKQIISKLLLLKKAKLKKAKLKKAKLKKAKLKKAKLKKTTPKKTEVEKVKPKKTKMKKTTPKKTEVKKTKVLKGKPKRLNIDGNPSVNLKTTLVKKAKLTPVDVNNPYYKKIRKLIRDMYRNKARLKKIKYKGIDFKSYYKNFMLSKVFKKSNLYAKYTLCKVFKKKTSRVVILSNKLKAQSKLLPRVSGTAVNADVKSKLTVKNKKKTQDSVNTKYIAKTIDKAALSAANNKGTPSTISKGKAVVGIVRMLKKKPTDAIIKTRRIFSNKVINSYANKNERIINKKN